MSDDWHATGSCRLNESVPSETLVDKKGWR
jgi:hypothetical protein